MPTPGIGAFTTAATQHADATLKLKGDQVIDSSTAKTTFVGKALTFLRNHSLLPEAASKTMASFKEALAQKHGEGTVKLLSDAVSTAKKELAALNKEYNALGYPHVLGRRGELDYAQVTEMRARLTAVIDNLSLGKTDHVTSKTVANADRLAGILAQHANDPMVKMMGPTKFLGYLLSVEKRIESGTPEVKTAAANMSVPEKVALYGYTCADYKTLNPALWSPKPDTPPGINAYIQHATSAIAKAPVFKTHDGDGLVLSHRAFNDPASNPGWAKARYADRAVVTEQGFYSTGQNKPMGATFSATIFTMGGGKDVSGFSAWPDEKEVIFAPGTQFHVNVDSKNQNHFIMVEKPASGRTA